MNQTIYPIGIQNFEKIRKDGYLYIDKTALVYQLVTTGPVSYTHLYPNRSHSDCIGSAMPATYNTVATPK